MNNSKIKNIELENIRDSILNHFLKEEFGEVKKKSNKMHELAIKLNNSFFVMWSYGQLGYMNYEIGEYDKGIKNLFRAITILHEGNRKFIDTGHLSLCFSKLNEMNEALFYVNLAVDASEKSKHIGALYEWYNFKANVLYKIKKYDDALKFVGKSIKNMPPETNKPEKFPLLVHYMPYLTKLEILCKMEEFSDAVGVYRIVKEKFDLIANPILHVRRDLKKFKDLELILNQRKFAPTS